MSRMIAILAVAAFALAASQTPAAAASKRSGTQVAGQQPADIYRVHRFKTWCPLPLRPYRSNITFAIRETRGCFRT